MGLRLIGTEVEGFIFDKEFNLVNNADEILEKIPQDKQKFFKTECSKAMIEIVSSPGTLHDVTKEITEHMAYITQFCEELGYRFLPVESYFGGFKSEMREYVRYNTKKQLIGENKFNLCGQICGHHIHFSLNDDESIRVRQINFLTFVDPSVIALSASSPSIGFNSWRTHTYRRKVHENWDFQGELQPFKVEYREYISQLHKQFELFNILAMEKGVEVQGINAYNGVWGPVRVSDKYNTVEIRSIGVSPNFATNIAIMTLIKGGMNIIEDPKGDVAQDSFLCFSEEQFRQLKNLSDRAIAHGLDNDGVYEFTQKLLNFCRQGLTERDQKLLEPIEQILMHRKNLSKEIITKYGESEIRDWTTEEAQKIHKELYEKYLNDLQICSSATKTKTYQ